MSTKKRNKIVIIQKEIEKVDDHVEYRVLLVINTRRVKVRI